MSLSVLVPIPEANAQTVACTGAPTSTTDGTTRFIVSDVSSGTCSFPNTQSGVTLGDHVVTVFVNTSNGSPNLFNGRVVSAGGGSLFGGHGVCDLGLAAGDMGGGTPCTASPPIGNFTATVSWDSTNTSTTSTGGTPDHQLSYSYSWDGTTFRFNSASLTMLNPVPDIDLTADITGLPAVPNGSTTTSNANGTDFGNRETGSTTVQRFNIRNQGTANLTINPGTVSVSGDNSDFAVTALGSNVITVPPGGLRQFNVAFSPTVAGLRQATISLPSNDPDESPYTFAVSGNGTTPAAPEINVVGNGQSIVDGDTTPNLTDGTDFGDALVTSGSVNRTFTIQNTGTDTLTFTDPNRVSISGPDSGSFNIIQSAPASLAPNGTADVIVQFAPTSLGPQNATLEIRSNDGDEGTYNFALTGNGTAASGADISVTLESAPNSVVQGGTFTYTTTVTNNGPDAAANVSIALTFDGITVNDTIASLASGSSQTFMQSRTVAGNITGQVTATVTATSSTADPDTSNNSATETTDIIPPDMPEIVVSGNGQNITNADTTPSTADGTDFGTVDATAGAVNRTFTITNIGESPLTLGANAASLSGVDAADFTIVTQPETTVAAGSGVTVLVVAFDPTTPGAKSVTVSIANNDDDESPFTFALAGNADAGAAADLSIVSGNDQTASINSGFEAPLVVRVTDSLGNPVSGVPITFTPPSAGASAVLSSLNAMTDSQGNANVNASANGEGGSYEVAVSANGLTTVVFSLTNQVGPTVEETQAAIATFLLNRANNIIGSAPDFSDFITGASQQGGGPLGNLALNADPFVQSFTFATSQSRIKSGFGSVQKTQQADETLLRSGLLPEENTSSFPDKTNRRGNFDIWTRISGTKSNNGTSESLLGVAHLGSHYFVSDNFLIGIVGQLDWAEEDNGPGNARADGFGWLVGPYIAGSLPDQNVFFDARFGWGQSNNTIAPDNTFEDDFDTTRWLASGKIGGSFRLDDIQIKPEVAISYFEERQESYVDTLSQFIPEQTISLGEFRFGPTIERTITLDNGVVLKPSLALSGIFNFALDDNPASQGFALGDENFRARFDAKFSLVTKKRVELSVDGYYDGLGTSSFKAYGANLKLKIPFQSGGWVKN